MTKSAKVLFVTDNGHGLGHLTRMMAVAKRADGRFQPVFLTMSEGFPIVREFGWPVEYLPSYKKLGLTKAQWEPLLASRLLNLLTHIEPKAVVVDHVFPSPVLATVKAETEGIDFVWSRRGMWRKGRNEKAIQSSGYFDVVVEPQDVAGPVDVGLTAEFHKDVTIVSPVLLLNPEEQMERSRARYSLGIPISGVALLINLSHSDVDRLSSLIAEVRDAVRSSIGDADLHLFSPLHVLHKRSNPRVDGVIMRPVYPVAKYLRAFDGIISTAGYNSFHEAVASGLPAIFVARDTDALDDQERRALFADLIGRAQFAQSVDDPSFLDALGRMLSANERIVAETVTQALGDFGGAAQFADVLADLTEARSDKPVVVGRRGQNQGTELEVLQRIESGPSLLDSDGSTEERVLVVTLGFEPTAFTRAVGQIAAIQGRRGGFKSLFLIDDVDPSSLDEFDFQYESVMKESEYEKIGSGSYDQYLEDCIGGFTSRYKPARVVKLNPAEPVHSELLLGEMK